MWPNELALLIVEMFGLTGDAVGYAVFGVIVFYGLVIMLIVGVPCAIAERKEKGR